jgi:hypothetical protein
MPPVGYVVLSTQPSQAEAELLAGLLRSGGISVAIDSAIDAEYPTAVGGGYRVAVPSERAAEAQQLLVRAEHVDPTDPGSSLDVGLPVDEDVRDYLAWRGDAADDDEAPESEPLATSASHMPLVMTGQKAPGLPLAPLLVFVALVVALVVWLR